ncbi:hypothetical protein [Alteromonas halophila]|uniref:Uncharacterized protein n=1 Tax=Alteromonas halophila TaxID=516698 RepID=A0A918JIT5_9ALTE|nr:hypothetical protein [Alteromonas halophila]GGW79448.1 hypothetical protein GCM10007391_10280 [Alteromonas halophila]
MNKKTYLRYVICLMAALSAVAAANPHTIDVELKVANAVDELLLFRDGQQIDIIDFPKNKKFIRFTFPDGYRKFDLKVFEMNEVAEKETIMAAYAASREQGVSQFNTLWRGHASSTQNAREFQVHQQGRSTLVVRNKNVDGTPEGVLHDYILRFSVNGITYLSDPSIRNKQN